MPANADKFTYLQVLLVSQSNLNISNLQWLYCGIIDNCRSDVLSELTEVETPFGSRTCRISWQLSLLGLRGLH